MLNNGPKLSSLSLMAFAALLLAGAASAKDTLVVQSPSKPAAPSYWDAATWDSSNTKDFWHLPRKTQITQPVSQKSDTVRTTPRRATTLSNNNRQSEK